MLARRSSAALVAARALAHASSTSSGRDSAGEQAFELGALDAPERAARPVAVQERDLELIRRRRGLLVLAEHPGAEPGRGTEVEAGLVGLLAAPP